MCLKFWRQEYKDYKRMTKEPFGRFIYILVVLQVGTIGALCLYWCVKAFISVMS